METKEKTVFIEYSSHKPQQHFMTIVQTKEHQRIIIGRVFREYNEETKKTMYHATDFEGNRIFADIQDLATLKRKFIEHGPSLANAVPNPRAYAKQNKPFVFSQKPERVNAIKDIRDKKTEKTKEVSKPKPTAKSTENQNEKIQDSKTTEKFKEVEQGKDGNIPTEDIPENIESKFEEPIENEQDTTSQRMEELEEIREEDNDKEQDLEIEM
jgi:hypothetical protein